MKTIEFVRRIANEIKRTGKSGIDVCTWCSLKGNVLTIERQTDEDRFDIECYSVFVEKDFIVKSVKDVERVLMYFIEGKCNGKITRAPETYRNMNKYLELHEKQALVYTFPRPEYSCNDLTHNNHTMKWDPIIIENEELPF